MRRGAGIFRCEARLGMSVSELDRWRAAQRLIEQHGQGALLEAAKRAHKAVAAGDLERGNLWLDIFLKLHQLRRAERPDKPVNRSRPRFRERSDHRIVEQKGPARVSQPGPDSWKCLREGTNACPAIACNSLPR